MPEKEEVTDMDIAKLAMNMTQVNTQQAVGTAVLGKAMDSQETAGEGLLKLMDAAAMELSVNPHIGGNFDMSV